MSLIKKEEEILKSIVVASENDPNKPEFPPDNPHWPSTPRNRRRWARRVDRTGSTAVQVCPSLGLRT